MRHSNGKAHVAAVVALAVLTLAAGAAWADVRSDRASAIVIFPRIAADDEFPLEDTVIQISNTSNEPQHLHCFYVNATAHCSSSGNACHPQTDPCPVGEGFCQPGWIETDFFIVLTPRQPIAWVASDGLSDGRLPLPGPPLVGPLGDSNQGTRIPPIGEVPFVGELKCIVTDAEGRPAPRNVIKGEATFVRRFENDDVDVAKYNAVGLEAFDADADENRVLVLGGGTNEYAGCPETLIVDHPFDLGLNPVSGEVWTSTLTLVPCSQDLLNQVAGLTTAQYVVYNEFEQRFSTSQAVDCYFERPLSRIDTTNPVRSIFSAFVSGTVVGQTRVRGVDGGLVGILVTESGTDRAAVNLHTQGDRERSDFIVLP